MLAVTRSRCPEGPSLQEEALLSSEPVLLQGFILDPGSAAFPCVLMTSTPNMFSSPLFSHAVTHEHLKDRALFSFPPPPPGANPSEYYHLMASASQRSPYGDLLMQNGAAAAAVHLPDYISPVDGENRQSSDPSAAHMAAMFVLLPPAVVPILSCPPLEADRLHADVL